LRAACEAAEILVASPTDETLLSRVRFSTLEGPAGRLLFVHSAYPTTDRDAVFFGPDSYRFASALARTVWKARRLIDVGCGAGVGGLVLASRAEAVVLADISPRALDLARVNAALAGNGQGDGGPVSLCQSDLLAQVRGDFDVVIANPPYLVDASPGQPGRLYRDGGGALGIDLAARIVTESLPRLATGGGQLVLYTGVPIIDGRNVLAERVDGDLRASGARWRWEELDPDVFGEELEKPAYRDTERLAVMLLTAELD
jgi:SAM-dependent methyltransferase